MAGPDIAAGDILVCEPTDVIHPDDRQLVAFLEDERVGAIPARLDRRRPHRARDEHGLLLDATRRDAGSREGGRGPPHPPRYGYTGAGG